MTVRRASALPRRLEVGEVERLVHLVGAHPLRDAGQRVDPGLGREDALAGVLVEQRAPVAVDLVHAVLAPVGRAVAVLVADLGLEGDAGLCGGGAAAAHAAALGGRRVVGQAVGLDHAVRDVDAEAVDTAVEPEAQDAAELLAHLVVGPVEVGLRAVEEVQVPLAGRAVGLGDAGPCGAAEDRLPVVRRQLAGRAAAVAEQVARALGAAGGGGERRLEPDVLVGRVVGHEVDDDADAACVRLGDHGVEVGERAEERVDVAVVGDVVAGVALGRGVERARARWRRCRAPAGRRGASVMPARSPMPSPFASANDRG